MAPRPGAVRRPVMKALLLRVGIDSTDGGWLAPVCAATGEFAYCPGTWETPPALVRHTSLPSM